MDVIAQLSSIYLPSSCFSRTTDVLILLQFKPGNKRKLATRPIIHSKTARILQIFRGRIPANSERAAVGWLAICSDIHLMIASKVGVRQRFAGLVHNSNNYNEITRSQRGVDRNQREYTNTPKYLSHFL
jgi:hypothetical protein